MSELIPKNVIISLKSRQRISTDNSRTGQSINKSRMVWDFSSSPLNSLTNTTENVMISSFAYHCIISTRYPWFQYKQIASDRTQQKMFTFVASQDTLQYFAKKNTGSIMDKSRCLNETFFCCCPNYSLKPNNKTTKRSDV